MSNLIYSSYYELLKRVESFLECEDYSSALDDVSSFVWEVMNSEFAAGRIHGSRKLDSICESIGQHFIDNFVGQERLGRVNYSPNKTVIVCTGLYKYGGTTHVINDLIRSSGQEHCIVLATNSFNDMNDDDISLRFQSSKVEARICDAKSKEDKLRWLVLSLIYIRPARIFLLNYNQDAIIISGAAPFTSYTSVIFYHHADYNLCLGVHLSGAIHIDPHNIGYSNCRLVEGISDNYYLPLSVQDKGVFRRPQNFDSKSFTTCSSASYHKFANFYFYPYTELLLDRLKTRSGVHIHIGKIPDSDLSKIYEKLESSGIKRERFVYVEWVPDLWLALVDLKVDLFISSFPHSSGRTSIEVMGAGIPILFHDGYLTRFHVGRDIVYPEVCLWKYPEEFHEHIERLTYRELRRQSLASRKFYIENYALSYDRMKEVLDAILEGSAELKPPPLSIHEPDSLDNVLHYSHLSLLIKNRELDALKSEFLRSRSWRYTSIFRTFFRHLRSLTNHLWA
jgi:hypothetical protein